MIPQIKTSVVYIENLRFLLPLVSDIFQPRKQRLEENRKSRVPRWKTIYNINVITAVIVVSDSDWLARLSPFIRVTLDSECPRPLDTYDF